MTEQEQAEQQVLCARQTIFDRELQPAAYELLYRATDTDEHSNIGTANQTIDGEQATRTVLNNFLDQENLTTLTGNLPAFVNFSEQLLLDRAFLLLPPNEVVIEILEDVNITPDIIAVAQEAHEQGFKLALDDFIYDPSYDPLLSFVEYVKLDLFELDAEGLKTQLGHLRHFKGDLIAEKVETQAIFDLCLKLSFWGFQGYFFTRPNIIKGKSLSSNQLVVLQLVQKLQDPDVTFDSLEEIIIQDPTLVYKLLRITNSAAYALRTEVTSIRDAIVKIGLNNVKNWALMISFSKLDDKPKELLTNLMIRAKMCSLVAENTVTGDTSSFFTAGMFSLIDALLDQPLASILETIPFDQSMKDALLNHTGPEGEVLDNVIKYEQGVWDGVKPAPVSLHEYAAAYVDSVSWANEVMSAL